jgi:hypothetical protein
MQDRGLGRREINPDVRGQTDGDEDVDPERAESVNVGMCTGETGDRREGGVGGEVGTPQNK